MDAARALRRTRALRAAAALLAIPLFAHDAGAQQARARRCPVQQAFGLRSGDYEGTFNDRTDATTPGPVSMAMHTTSRGTLRISARDPNSTGHPQLSGSGTYEVDFGLGAQAPQGAQTRGLGAGSAPLTLSTHEGTSFTMTGAGTGSINVNVRAPGGATGTHSNSAPGSATLRFVIGTSWCTGARGEVHGDTDRTEADWRGRGYAVNRTTAWELTAAGGRNDAAREIVGGLDQGSTDPVAIQTQFAAAASRIEREFPDRDVQQCLFRAWHGALQHRATASLSAFVGRAQGQSLEAAGRAGLELVRVMVSLGVDGCSADFVNRAREILFESLSRDIHQSETDGDWARRQRDEDAAAEAVDDGTETVSRASENAAVQRAEAAYQRMQSMRPLDMSNPDAAAAYRQALYAAWTAEMATGSPTQTDRVQGFCRGAGNCR